MMAFKHMLALAWTIRSFEGEFAAYEGLSKSYLYQGMIEKVKFYDDRITEGEYEPPDSQLYKISISSMVNEHPWLKETDPKAKPAKKTRLETAQEAADDLSKMETHLVGFFSDKIKDFSLMKPDTVKTIKEVNNHFYSQANTPRKHEEMRDPAIQYLDTLQPIGTPRICAGVYNGAVKAVDENQQRLCRQWEATRAD